jgi:hypothetical protein
VLHLHPNWGLQCGIEVTDREQGLDATQMQVAGFLRIRSGVFGLEEGRFVSIIRLGIKRYLGTSTPFAKDHKRSVYRDPA